MEEYIELICVPFMTSIVYTLLSVLKHAFKGVKLFDRLVPLLALVIGCVLGIITFYALPELLMAENIFIAILMGAASGMSSIGFNQMFQQIPSSKKNKIILDSDTKISNENIKIMQNITSSKMQQNDANITDKLICINNGKTLTCEVENNVQTNQDDTSLLQTVMLSESEINKTKNTVKDNLVEEISKQIINDLISDKKTSSL